MRDYECETSEYSESNHQNGGWVSAETRVSRPSILPDIDVVWEACFTLTTNRHPERYGEDNAELLATTLAKNAPIAGGDVREPRSPATVV